MMLEKISGDIEKFQTTDTGYGLRTSTDLTEGFVIITKKPYAHILTKDQRPFFCDQCIKRRQSLSKCSGCKITKYCNRTCQKNAWACHKEECKALRQCGSKLPPDFVQLLGRILWKMNDDNYGDSIDMTTVLDLESNYENLGQNGKEILGMYLSILPYYWGNRPLPSSVSSPKALLNLAAKVKNNSFAIMDTESHTDIGTGLYLSCNLLNHSCRPNCVVTFTESVMSVHAIRFIHRKEELTISYTDNFAPSDERREELLTVYGFDCQCFACSINLHDERMLQDFNGKCMSSSKRQSARQLVAKLDTLHKEGNHEEIREMCESFVQRQVLPKHNIYMNKVLGHGMDAAIQLKMYELALTWGLMSIPAHKEYLIDNHPATGLLLMKLGKLLMYVNNIKEATALLKEALGILKYSQYEKGTVLQELIQLITQCQVELKKENEEMVNRSVGLLD